MSSTTDSLPPSLAKIVQRFKRATDQKRRYEQLIWYGQKLSEFPEANKVAENKVAGCVSQVYVTAALDEVTPDFIQETGLNVSLTPSRANGFYNIFKTMQKKAWECGSDASNS